MSSVSDKIQELKEKQLLVVEEIKKLKKISLTKTFEQKRDEKSQRLQGKWPMINLIQRYIMAYAIFDFTFQIIFQMPTLKHSPIMEVVGLRKVWVVRTETGLSYT